MQIAKRVNQEDVYITRTESGPRLLVCQDRNLTEENLIITTKVARRRAKLQFLSPKY